MERISCAVGKHGDNQSTREDPRLLGIWHTQIILKYSEDATILFKKPNLNGVHTGEVKLVEGDWHIAGRSGYTLVITRSGRRCRKR